MPYVVTAEHNHEMSLDRHHAHQYRPQGPASQAPMHSHSNSPHQSYIGASQAHPSSYLTSSTSAPPSLATPNSSNVASSSSSLLPSPSSLSLTAGAHWHHPSHATPSHSQQHLNGTSRQRPYDSGDHETSASSSYSTSWGQPRQQWAFADETYNDTFPPHSSSTSSNNAYYSTPSYSSSSSNSNLGALVPSSTSSSLSNAVGSFSYSNLSGSPSLPSSLASSTLPSSSSTPLSSHQERPKLEPASWNPHSQQQQSHSQSQYYPLTINSRIDLSMDECMSPLTPISPSFSVSSPPSRSSASTNTMRGTKIKQEDEDVEHTDGFVFEMPGPSPSHHPFASSTHSMSSPNLLGNSRESLKRGRTASMSLGHASGRGSVVPQFSSMSVVPLRATQASADMKKMMGAFRLDPFTMQNSFGERPTRKRSNTDAKENEKGKGRGKKRKGSKASTLLDFEDDLELDDDEEGLGKNWLGEDIGPLIGDTMLVEFEVGLIEPLLDPSVYPSTSSSTSASTSYSSNSHSNSNSNWYQDSDDSEQDDATYGNERGRRGLGPSESNMMPFLSVVALSPRDYSLGSAHQALVARHLVAGEPAPKPLNNLSVGGPDDSDTRIDEDHNVLSNGDSMYVYSYNSDNRHRQSMISLGAHSSSHSHLYSQDLGFNLPMPIVPSNAPQSSDMSILTSGSQTSSSLIGSLNFVGGAYQSAYASSASLKAYGVDDSLMSSTSGGHQHHHQSPHDHRQHLHHPRTISLGSDQDSNPSSGTTSTLMTPAQSLQWSLQGRESSNAFRQWKGDTNGFDSDGYDRDTLGGLGGLSRRSRPQQRTPSPISHSSSNFTTQSIPSSPHRDARAKTKSLVDHIRQSTFHPTKRTSANELLDAEVSMNRVEEPIKNTGSGPSNRYHPYRTDSASSHRSHTSTNSSTSSCPSPVLLTPTSTCTTNTSVPSMNLATMLPPTAVHSQHSQATQLPQLPLTLRYKRQASDVDITSYAENVNVNVGGVAGMGISPYSVPAPMASLVDSNLGWYGTVLGR